MCVPDENHLRKLNSLLKCRENCAKIELTRTLNSLHGKNVSEETLNREEQNSINEIRNRSRSF